ncbi:MAG: glycerophosphodiester phosphodiesterase [Planctomycetota bacterium]|jgi:glycerophosphoryl diester phosphodiesterase
MNVLPRFVGHRGARELAPENTLAGIRLAARLGAPWVEVDVKLSSDNRPILMHDDTLERTTDGSGYVAETPWSVIAELDAGGWFGEEYLAERVPDLELTVALLAQLGLGANIELKPCEGRDEQTGALVADTLLSLWRAHMPRPVLSSYSEIALAAAREMAPELPRGLLVTDVPPDWQERMARLDCVSLHVGQRQLERPTVEAIKAEDVPLMAYTVNEPERATELWSWGVDCVATDRPDLIARC